MLLGVLISGWHVGITDFERISASSEILQWFQAVFRSVHLLLPCFHLPEQLPEDAQGPSTGVPGSTLSPRDCWRLTEQDWHLVERSQEELAALTGCKDGLSELRCLALLEAGGMQGVQQHQQSPAGAGKALPEGGGGGCSSSLACHGRVW